MRRPRPNENGSTPTTAPDVGRFRKRCVFARWPRTRLPSAARLRRDLDAALETETAFGTPFLLVPLFLILGVTIYFSLPVEPAPHNILTGLCVVAGLCWFSGRRAPLAGRSFMATATILTGMAIGQAHTRFDPTPMLGSAVATRLTGRIVRIERRANGSVRYTLDVIATERPRLRYAPDRVRVTARHPVDGVRAGDGLAGRAQLRPPSGPVRPGSYDFAFHNYFAGWGANGFFYGAPEPVAVPSPAGWWPQAAIVLENGRGWLSARIRAAAPGENGVVAAALITGDRTAIADKTNEALRVSGLAHILTISGLHMALVAGTVLFVLRAGFAVFAGFSARRPAHKYAAIVALTAVCIYLFLAGASIATQRAFIMLSVMLGALMADRRAISKRNLAIAAIIIIVLFPGAVVGPSFQMSFAATLALIALYDVWNRHRRQRRAARFTPQDRAIGPFSGAGAWRFFATLAATSLVAGAASGLYAAYHFNRIAVLGLFTNLAAMPIVSLLTMPLAIVATLAIPFGLDGYLYAAMAMSVGWILVISDAVANRSPPGMFGIMPASAMIAASIALMWLCVCRTPLRWVAIVPALAAWMLGAQRDTPILVISEDGRQMAAIGENGTMAVNRNRPSAFITDQWRTAYRAPDRLRPLQLKKEAPLPPLASGQGGAGLAVDRGNGETVAADAFEEVRPMVCNAMLCHGAITRGDRRWTYLIASQPEPVTVDLCLAYDVIILAHAPATSPCGSAHAMQTALVITAQTLALQGSAAIHAHSRGRNLKVRHAVAYPFRPWHDQRRYSRAARNLAERR